MSMPECKRMTKRLTATTWRSAAALTVLLLAAGTAQAQGKDEPAPLGVGDMRIFAFDFTPRGFLRCDGKVYPVKDHADLYAVLQNRFGGEEKKTFGVPVAPFLMVAKARGYEEMFACRKQVVMMLNYQILFAEKVRDNTAAETADLAISLFNQINQPAARAAKRVEGLRLGAEVVATTKQHYESLGKLENRTGPGALADDAAEFKRLEEIMAAATANRAKMRQLIKSLPELIAPVLDPKTLAEAKLSPAELGLLKRCHAAARQAQAALKELNETESSLASLETVSRQSPLGATVKVAYVIAEGPPDGPFTGEIRMMMTNFRPRGWDPCDGQLVGIAQHTSLFSLLGTRFGGDGIRTFALPRIANPSGDPRQPPHYCIFLNGTYPSRK